MTMFVNFICAVIFIFFSTFSSVVCSAIQIYSFETSAQEQTFYTLTKELRCPKCQNQSVADSDAMIAQDIKARIYAEVREGKTEKQIIAGLAQRYGDFIYYQPAFNRFTALLWLGPPALLVVVIVLVVINISRRRNEIESEMTQEEDN